MADIKWPIARRAGGIYVRVSDAERGGAYTCPECDWRFIPRQGAKKRWHFAHYFGADCSGEGSRHSVAKHLIAMFLEEPFEIELGPCYHDLSPEPPRIETVIPTEIAVEKGAGEYRPDIAFSVRWRGKERRVFVEVVDTHETPKEKAAALSGMYFDVAITDMNDEEIFDGTMVINAFKKRLSDHLFWLDAPSVFGFLHSWTQSCINCSEPTRVAMDCGVFDDMIYGLNYDRHEYWLEAWLPGAKKVHMPAVLLHKMKAHARMKWDGREGHYCNYNACTHCGASQEVSMRIGEALDDLDEHTGELTSSVTTEYWQTTLPINLTPKPKRHSVIKSRAHPPYK